jgi:hypothetical protein
MTLLEKSMGKDNDVIPWHSPKLGTSQGDAYTNDELLLGEIITGARKISSILRSLMFSS